MKQIETSKGMFVVIDDKKETHYPFHMYIQLYGDNYYKLSEITEDEAKYIIGGDLFDSYLLIPMDYYRYKLNSLLKLQGIEITNNTYIFKI